MLIFNFPVDREINECDYMTEAAPYQSDFFSVLNNGLYNFMYNCTRLGNTAYGMN